MMDIVRRLREGRTNGTDLRWAVSDVHVEAADEIVRLRSALERIADIDPDDTAVFHDIANSALNPGDRKNIESMEGVE